MDVVSWRWRWRDGGRNQLMGWMDKVLARAPKPFAHNAVVHVARAHCGPPLWAVAVSTALFKRGGCPLAGCRSGKSMLAPGRGWRLSHQAGRARLSPKPRSHASFSGISRSLFASPSIENPPPFPLSPRPWTGGVCECVWVLLVLANPACAQSHAIGHPRFCHPCTRCKPALRAPVSPGGKRHNNEASSTDRSHRRIPFCAPVAVCRIQTQRQRLLRQRGPAPGFMVFDPHGGPGRQQQVNGQGLFLSFSIPRQGTQTIVARL